MKSKFKTFILFLLMVFLIFIVTIFAKIIYFDVLGLGTTDTIYTVNTITNDVQDKKDIANTVENTNVNKDTLNIQSYKKFFYNQLTNTQKKLYDGLYQNKENMMSGTYKISFGDVFSDILSQEDGQTKLGDDYQSAVEAFLYDNPDVFYIDANKLYLTVETSRKLLKKTYNVYIGASNGDNDTYYVDGFKSEEQVKKAMNRIDSIKNQVLYNLTTNDSYRNILKIHDYLISNVDYDQNYSSIGCYSIYGAFIDHKCVCEGYAKSLKYLLDSANIPCVIVQGMATNSNGKTENHAWNSVYLNDSWYYIDTTWNDPIIIGSGSISKSVQYKYFLKGSNTMNKDHTLIYKFSDRGKTFWYPKTSEKDYK